MCLIPCLFEPLGLVSRGGNYTAARGAGKGKRRRLRIRHRRAVTDSPLCYHPPGSMPSDVVGRVLENQPLGGRYFLPPFDPPTIASTCEPGQFVMAGSTDPTELLLRRPFSVCLVG